MVMATLVDKNAGLDVRCRPLCQEMVVTKNRNMKWERRSLEISAAREMCRPFPFLPTAPSHTQVAGHLKRLETEDGLSFCSSKISKNPLERPLRTAPARRTLGPAVAGQKWGWGLCAENGTSTRIDLQVLRPLKALEVLVFTLEPWLCFGEWALWLHSSCGDKIKSPGKQMSNTASSIHVGGVCPRLDRFKRMR